MTNEKVLLKKNIIFGLISKIIIMIFAIASKSLVINVLGTELNGFYSFLVSTLGILMFSELGFNLVLTFSMYEDVSKEDYNRLKLTYDYFKKIIKWVLLAIVVISLVFVPFLKVFIKEELNTNIYISYFIFLISVILTFVYSPKIAVINAHKEDYITTIVHAIIKVIENTAQIILILVTKNFYYYLVILIISKVIEGVLIEFIYNKKYKEKLIEIEKDNIDPEKKEEINVNVRSILINKLSRSILIMIDSLLISYFINVTTYGRYANYLLIANSLLLLISIFFNETTSIVGHRFINEEKGKMLKAFNNILYFNFVIGIIFFLGFFAISNGLVELFFNKTEVLDIKIVLLISINYFIMFISQSSDLYKRAGGLFSMDKLTPAIEGAVNLLLSILLVFKFNIYGVIIASIISKLVVLVIIDSIIIYRNLFEKRPMEYILKLYFYVLLFVGGSVGLFFIFKYLNLSLIWTILVNGFISVGVSLILILYPTIKNRKEIKEVVLSLKKSSD